MIPGLCRLTHEEAYHVARRSKHGDFEQLSRSTLDLDEARAWCRDGNVVVLVRTETYLVQ